MSQDFDCGQTPRLLRWVFGREDRTLMCQLALDPQARLYEFRTWPGHAPASTTVELFIEVGRAFNRQCEYESALIADGWTLQAYESREMDYAA